MRSSERARGAERRCSAVAILVANEEGKFLVLWHRKYRFWTVPLGKIEPGEQGIAAAHREALEELGILPERIDLLETVYKPPKLDDCSDIAIALCCVTSYSGTIANREPDKHDHFRFLHPSDFASLEPLSFPTRVIADRLGNRANRAKTKTDDGTRAMKTGREKFGAFVHRDGRGCGPPSVTGAEGEEGEGKSRRRSARR